MRNHPRRSLAPFLMLITGVLLIAGAVISGILLSRNPALAPSSAASNPGEIAQIPQNAIPRVSVEEAKSALDSGEAVFVDVRPVESYEQDHIPGSVSIPLNEIEARLDELDPDAWIITYCT